MSHVTLIEWVMSHSLNESCHTHRMSHVLKVVFVSWLVIFESGNIMTVLKDTLALMFLLELNNLLMWTYSPDSNRWKVKVSQKCAGVYTCVSEMKKSCLSAHCNAMHHTATHCKTLQHAATHCNILCMDKPYLSWDQVVSLQHTAAHCNMLQHTATHCNTLQHTATHFL